MPQIRNGWMFQLSKSLHSRRSIFFSPYALMRKQFCCSILFSAAFGSTVAGFFQFVSDPDHDRDLAKAVEDIPTPFKKTAVTDEGDANLVKVHVTEVSPQRLGDDPAANKATEDKVRESEWRVRKVGLCYVSCLTDEGKRIQEQGGWDNCKASVDSQDKAIRHGSQEKGIFCALGSHLLFLTETLI